MVAKACCCRASSTSCGASRLTSGREADSDFAAHTSRLKIKSRPPHCMEKGQASAGTIRNAIVNHSKRFVLLRHTLSSSSSLASTSFQTLCTPSASCSAPTTPPSSPSRSSVVREEPRSVFCPSSSPEPLSECLSSVGLTHGPDEAALPFLRVSPEPDDLLSAAVPLLLAFDLSSIASGWSYLRMRSAREPRDGTDRSDAPGPTSGRASCGACSASCRASSS